MALIAGVATAAAVAATVVSASTVRRQQKQMAVLEDMVSTLQDKADHFEAVPKVASQKRRETSQATRSHIDEHATKHQQKEVQLEGLKERVQEILGNVGNLQEKCEDFESMPKLMSVKQRESEESAKATLGALEAMSSEREDHFSTLNADMLTMLELIESLDKRIGTLAGPEPEEPQSESECLPCAGLLAKRYAK